MTYLDELADAIRREVDPAALPDGDTASLFRLYAVLLLAKGVAVTAEDVHNAWAAWMSGRDPAHQAIKPYRQLPDDIRRSDQPFLEAIRRVASRL
jgi:hypothetical protein